MNRKLAAWMLLAAGATPSAQDARQMVEESQRARAPIRSATKASCK